MAGVDVGAFRLDVVLLDTSRMGSPRMLDVRTFEAGDLSTVAAWVSDAVAIGIDSPDALSTAPHAGDESLSPKFRVARCGEISLGQTRGIWVPWVTPQDEPVPSWMRVGIDLFSELRARGRTCLEVYPHGVFVTLAGGRRPSRKTTRAGRNERAVLLADRGVDVAGEASHHTLDAAAAALTAADHACGAATRITCGHDGSEMWLPRRVA